MFRFLAFVALASLGTAACGDNSATPKMPDATVPHPDAPEVADAGVDAPGIVDFTETYDPDTQDVGDWILTTDPDRAHMLQATGGHPGGYLYGEVESAIPTWSTASTRFQPGINDSFKRDSVFVGDYYTAGIKTLGVDLEVIQAGSWTSDRTITLHLLGWDVATNGVAFDAFYSLPDMPTAPVRWNHYDFVIDAQSPTIPAGWSLTRGDGTPGTDADWATFMHQIDLVGFGFWKPDYVYPNLNLWELGIDNIHISALP